MATAGGDPTYDGNGRMLRQIVHGFWFTGSGESVEELADRRGQLFQFTTGDAGTIHLELFMDWIDVASREGVWMRTDLTVEVVDPTASASSASDVIVVDGGSTPQMGFDAQFGSALVAALLATGGTEPEFALADLDGDGDADLADFAMFQAAFGTTGGTRYTWNTENRLAGVEPLAPNTDDKKLQFAYDHMGRRVLKRVWTYTAGSWGNPTAETKYVYDGWRVIMELDGLNSDAVTRKFTWGLDLSGSVEGAGGIGGLLAAEDTAGTTVTTDDRTFIYFYELNGNVGQLVETTTGTDYGTIAAKYEYDPYGKRINAAAIGEYDQPYRFSTKPVDDETGLGNWGYRYYSYDLGRWVSWDPIEERGGVNLYGYVGNMPTAYSDADGCDLYINPASPSTVPWLPGGTDFPLDEYRPTSPSYPVANSWLQLLANYVDGTGQGVRLGRSLMTQVASTTGFRERVRQAVSGFVGKAKSAADCCEKNIRIISAGGDYVDEWGASWIPGHGLTAPFPSIQTMFSVNNYSLTWLGVGKFSCNTGSGECCLCKGTFDLSFELTDTFTLKGLKNTIFNAIPGSSFATFGKWSIDSIPFSFIHCD